MFSGQGVQPGHLRDLNERAVYRAVRANPPLTGADLARATSLSKPTVSSALRSLVSAGLVKASASRPTSGPGTYYEAVASAALAVGVEVQRRSVRAALTDLDGRELERVVIPGRHTDAKAVFAAVAQAVRELVPTRRRTSLRSVVVGLPGIIHPATGVLSNSGVVPALDGTRPAARLEALVPAPVTVMNDVDLAALGEQAMGGGHGLQHFAVLSIGEGMGAALVLNGQLYEGAHGGAGEIDDVPFRRLVRSTTPVSPALDGLVGLASALAPQHPGSRLAPPYTPDAMFDALDRGDPLAVAVVDRLAEWAGWFAAALTAVVDPEAIVLAGSIGAREPLAQRVAEHLDRFAPTTPRLVVSALGDGSVLAGAVALASAQALVRRLDERRRPA